jgi:glyoxylase-like metal-dependent hydrolase (beta-lactamase superfamily II)
MTQSVPDFVHKIEIPIPFPLETVNVFLIDRHPRTLIDAGIKTVPSLQALEKGLAALGVSLSSIERILITHGHIDHYGLAKTIASLSGARIFIHKLEYGRLRSILHALGFLKAVLLRNGVPRRMVNEAIRYIASVQKMADPLEEAFFLEDGDPIPFDSMTWKAIQCPGHSPGLLCFYWPGERILFSGDHLLKDITPNPILNVPETRLPYRYPSLQQYLASLKRVEGMDIDLLLPAHGEKVTDVKELIRKIYGHHRERMGRIVSILSGGEKTAYDVAAELFSGLPPFEVFLGISEALGHLEILRDEGRVTVREHDEKDYYALRT